MPSGRGLGGLFGFGRLRFGRFEKAVALVAAGGLLLRVVYILVEKRPLDACGKPLCGDAIFYSTQAVVLGDGDGFTDPFRAGFPAADHPPLTSLVLAPLAAVTESVTAQRLVMALVGTVTIVVLALLARRLAGNRAGVVAAVIAALDPNLWMNDGLVMSESLAALGIALILLSLYRFVDEPSARRAAEVGAICGLTALARAEMLLFLPIALVPLVLFAKPRAWSQRLGRVAIAGGVAVVVLLPWVGFNLTRFEEPVFLSTNDGITLLGANCERVYFDGGIGFWNLACTFDVADQVDLEGDQSVVSAEYRRLAVDYISEHTDRLLPVAAIRVARVWNFYGPDQMVYLNEGEGRERWASWSGVYASYVLLAASIGGVVVLRRRGISTWPLVSTAVIVTVTAAAFYGIVRFRLPADVAMVVLTAIAVDAVLRRRGTSLLGSP